MSCSGCVDLARKLAAARAVLAEVQSVYPDAAKLIALSRARQLYRHKSAGRAVLAACGRCGGEQYASESGRVYCLDCCRRAGALGGDKSREARRAGY